MAKQIKEYDRSLVERREWTDLVKSMKVGIYEVELPDFSAMRSLQVIISRFNAKPAYKFVFSIITKFDDMILEIKVNKRK